MRGIFRNTTSKHNTRLSTYIWKLKEEGKDYEINWEIMDRAPTRNPVNMKYSLCLKEIYYICRPHSASLNKRNELFRTCRHMTRKLLINSWKYLFTFGRFWNFPMWNKFVKVKEHFLRDLWNITLCIYIRSYPKKIRICGAFFCLHSPRQIAKLKFSTLI